MLKHFFRYFKQRRKYGFDERETWNLDYTFIEWVYKHCKLYYEVANEIIDLSWSGNNVIYKEKEMTQKEVIERILSLCEQYFEAANMNEENWSVEKEDEAEKNLNEVVELWAIVWRNMWW